MECISSLLQTTVIMKFLFNRKMNKLLKILIGLFLISVNYLAISDILQRSEEALKLEYTLISVSFLFTLSYILKSK